MGIGRGTAALACALALAGCAGTPSSPTSPSPSSPSSLSPSSSSASPSSPSTTTAPALPLAGKVVVLDPGHNGGNGKASRQIAKPVPAGGFTKPCNTTGTETDDGYAEHTFTFDVVRRAKGLLEARGAKVVLTRSDDVGVGPCVDARAAVANRSGADLAVSVHADGGSAGARGFHVIEPGPAPDGGNGKILAPSAAAAQDLLAAFAKATGSRRATYTGSLVEPGLTRRTDLAGLNLARVPALMIECANLRNTPDATAARSPAWRQKAAQGITDGITTYLTAD